MGKKRKQIKVFYCSKGLANFYGDYIEINKKLKYNKKVRDYIIKHELGHSKEFDLGHEFQIDWKIMPSLLFFFFTTPSTWIDLLPIQFKDGQIIYDINLVFMYLFLITSGVLAVRILTRLH